MDTESKEGKKGGKKRDVKEKLGVSCIWKGRKKKASKQGVGERCVSAAAS